MAKRIPFPGFVGSAFAPQSPNVDLQDLNNWYEEASESPYAKVATSLLPCPGFTTKLTLPTSPVRGLFAQNDRLFAVGGTVLYEISRSWVATPMPITALTTPAAPTITNSPLTPAISAPATPLITQGGALGRSSYGYKVTAINSRGETTGSVEGTTAVGNATLSSTAYNIITWTAVTGATGYKVYRTTGTGSGKLIATVTSSTLFVLDTGTAGTTASPPGSNTTAGTAGTTTYGYKVVATLGIGQTAASAEGLTFTGQATLNDDNYNIITWPAVLNAHQYKVYRTTGGTPTPPRLIGTTTALTLNDEGDEDAESETPSSADTTATFTLTNDGMPVSWASSGDAGQQLIIGSGGSAFVFDLVTSTLGKVVDGATAVGFIGTYFVILDAATSTMKSSESLDGYAWDPLQIYQRTAAGDRWLGMAVTSNEIILFGSKAADVWKLTGDADTRFAPFQDVTIDEGIIAPASLQVSGGMSMWVGQNSDGAGIIWRTNGYDKLQTSTRGIEKELASYDTLADAVAWTYQMEGHTFYVLTFPSDGRTWVYDVLTQRWHRRGFFDPNTMDYTAYRPQCHAFAFGGIGFGTHVVGDRESGVIAELRNDISTDFEDQQIRRLRQCPHITDEMLETTIWSLVIDLQVGKGTATGQGADPTIMLQISRDGGQTWGDEIWRSTGAQGKYLTRVKFNRLGIARDWVFRFVVTDPIAWQIAGAYFEPESGDA